MGTRRKKDLKESDEGPVKIVGLNHGLCLAINLGSEGWKQEKFADVSFLCCPGDDIRLETRKVLRANRSVLAAASPYFAIMLPDCELENDVCITTEWPYEDVFCVIEYIYTGRLMCPLQKKESIMEILKELKIHGPSNFQNDLQHDDSAQEASDTSLNLPLGDDDDRSPVSMGTDEAHLDYDSVLTVQISDNPKSYKGKRNQVLSVSETESSSTQEAETGDDQPVQQSSVKGASNAASVTADVQPPSNGLPPVEPWEAWDIDTPPTCKTGVTLQDPGKLADPTLMEPPPPAYRFYPLAMYHQDTWCHGVYSPISPFTRVISGPLFGHYLPGRGKSKSLTVPRNAPVIPALARESTTASVLPEQKNRPETSSANPLPGDKGSSDLASTDPSKDTSRQGTGGRVLWHLVDEVDTDEDKVDLALANHFLAEEVRIRHGLHKKIRAFTEQRTRYGRLAQEILKTKAEMERRRLQWEAARKAPVAKKPARRTPCEHCGKMVVALRLKQHMQTHIGVKSHLCEQCGRTFLIKSNLKAHIRVNHSERIKEFMCVKCGYTCDTKYGLEKHEIIHTDELPFQCQYCDRKFRHQPTLVRHIRTHTGERPHVCEVCGASFAVRYNLVAHQKRMHETKSRVPSLSNAKPERDENTKHLIYRCEFCQKTFHRVLTYENHRATHTGETASIGCAVEGCNFTYSNMSQLKDHMAAAHPDRTFTCQECCKVFLSKQALINHQVKHDPNSGYQCSYCPVRVTSKTSLVTHEKIHSREEPYECNVCGVRFHSSFLMKRHLPTHQPGYRRRIRTKKKAVPVIEINE